MLCSRMQQYFTSLTELVLFTFKFNAHIKAVFYNTGINIPKKLQNY